MVASEQSPFDDSYARHLGALKPQGKAPATVDGCDCALRRIATCFDRCRIGRVACATTSLCTARPRAASRGCSDGCPSPASSAVAPLSAAPTPDTPPPATGPICTARGLKRGGASLRPNPRLRIQEAARSNSLLHLRAAKSSSPGASSLLLIDLARKEEFLDPLPIDSENLKLLIFLTFWIGGMVGR